MLIGLVMFAGASVAAAWADGAGVLIAARAVMGLGGAIILPVAFAVIHSLFDPPERARAVSLVVMDTALGLPLGPLLGGWLLDHFWWGSIFLVNLPVAAIAILILAIALPESRGSVQRRPDVAGGLLSTAGLVGVVYGLIEAPDRGWTDPLVSSTVIAGILTYRSK